MELKIYGDPVLKERAESISDINSEIEGVVKEMFRVMYEAKGIGLAAPQVGVSKRIITVDLGNSPLALINPIILERDKEKERMEEGCLSLPGIEVDVERPYRVFIKGLNLKEKEVEIEAKGLLARVFQHEIDHLDGILIIDKVSFVKKQFLINKLKRLLREKKGYEAPPMGSAL